MWVANGPIMSREVSAYDPPLLPSTTSAFAASESYDPKEGIMYAANTNYIAIYWSGLPANKKWIRVDTVRKFNGIPKQAYRDVVDIARCKKNFDAKKTFNILRQLCINTPVGGHSLKDVERQMDKIVTNLPNVSYLMDSGEPLQVGSMEELANSLETPGMQ